MVVSGGDKNFRQLDVEALEVTEIPTIILRSIYEIMKVAISPVSKQLYASCLMLW